MRTKFFIKVLFMVATLLFMMTCGKDFTNDEPDVIPITPTNGTLGASLKWDFKNGTLTITGNGAMPDYTSFDVKPWHQATNYYNGIINIVIEEGVTGIGSYNFNHTPNVVSAKLPNSLKRIGDYAFQSCTNLKSLNFPEGLTEIGSNAFSAHCGLTSVTIPKSIEKIGKAAFDSIHLNDIYLLSEDPFKLQFKILDIIDFSSLMAPLTLHLPYGTKYLYNYIDFPLYENHKLFKIVDGTEDEPANLVDLGDGIYMSGKDSDPNGTLVKVKITQQQFEQIDVNIVTGFFPKIYDRFNDDFDFILCILDNKSIDGVNLPFLGIHSTVSNDIEGLGMDIYSNASRYGSAGKLKGYIFTYFRKLYTNILNHEICHQWGNMILKEADLTWNNTYGGGHFYATNAKSIIGHEYDIQLVENNSGGVTGKRKYKATDLITTSDRYGDIDLYMMGLKSAQELRTAKFSIESYRNIGFDDEKYKPTPGTTGLRFYDPGPNDYGTAYFTTTEVVTYTIDDIIKINGERKPAYPNAQKHFKMLLLLFTTDPESETRDIQSVYQWYEGNIPSFEKSINSRYNFSEATSGRGSIEVSGLHNSLKPKYKQLIDRD